jgi:transcriptional regulator with XRE-family HTH domain
MTNVEKARLRKINRTLGPGNYHRIARETGVTPQHISRFIRGLRGATFELAIAVAESAGVGLDDLRWYMEVVAKIEAGEEAA